ncbi:hypothetical protein [Erwinia sorbitola]|nr:hypothetical protein [Erwinia sorbitola]
MVDWRNLKQRNLVLLYLYGVFGDDLAWINYCADSAVLAGVVIR